MNTFLKRLIMAISLNVLIFIFIGKYSNYGFGTTICVTILLIYLAGEMLWSLILNGNKLVISGFLLLFITTITFALGLWENNNQNISKEFIVSVAIIAGIITYKDLLDVTELSEIVKKRISTVLYIFCFILVTVFLMVKTESMTQYIKGLNTDFITFISLSLALSTMGLRELKMKTIKKQDEKQD